MQSNDDDLLPAHHNFGGVANGVKMTGKLHECEDIRRKGISLGEADRRQKRNHHSKEAVLSLRNFYNNETPYPDDRQLYKLSKLPNLSGLTIKQINTWFCNERERKRRNGTGSAGVNYKTLNNHPDAAINVLRAWVDAHPGSGRPTAEEKIQLANKAELTLKKVSYWFENNRKNHRKLALKLQRNEQVDIEVNEAILGTSEFESPDPRENAEVVQQTGDDLEPLQDKNSSDDMDDWDLDLWESCIDQR